MRSRCRQKFFLISTILLLVPAAFGQDSNIQFRLAQELEQKGDYEHAVQVYEQLFAKDSTNYVFFDALRRGYLNLKRYDDAVHLIENCLAAAGSDLNLKAMLGEAYYRAGEEERAFAKWGEALALDPRNPQVYRFIANSMMQNRLFDRAVDVYLRGRKSCGDASLFSVELANLYAIVMNFAQATREYLGMVEQNNSQLNYVESRISTYSGRPDGLAAAISVVEEELKSKHEVLWLWRLLAWLYMEGKQFDRAYSVYLTIDQLSNARGSELFAFADRAFREKAYLTSYRAFRKLLDKHPENERRLYAQFGLARSMEELSRVLADSIESPDSLTFAANEPKPSFQQAVDLYERVAAEQPRSAVAAQALLRVGLIRYQRLFDLDGALEALQRGEQAAPGTPTNFDIRMRVGEVWVAKGDLDRAEEAWRRLGERAALSPELRQEIEFDLAQLDYYRGQFDAAEEKLDAFVQQPQLDFTNDALMLQSLIKENRVPDDSALKLYARAEFNERQRKYSEAVGLLEEIPKDFPSSPLRDEALMKIAALQSSMKNYGEAVATYRRVTTDFGNDSAAVDRARLEIAEIYQFHLRDSRKAIEAYETLLEKNPNSIYADRARKRIRQLRGDEI